MSAASSSAIALPPCASGTSTQVIVYRDQGVAVAVLANLARVGRDVFEITSGLGALAIAAK